MQSELRILLPLSPAQENIIVATLVTNNPYFQRLRFVSLIMINLSRDLSYFLKKFEVILIDCNLLSNLIFANSIFVFLKAHRGL